MRNDERERVASLDVGTCEWGVNVDGVCDCGPSVGEEGVRGTAVGVGAEERGKCLWAPDEKVGTIICPGARHAMAAALRETDSDHVVAGDVVLRRVSTVNETGEVTTVPSDRAWVSSRQAGYRDCFRPTASLGMAPAAPVTAWRSALRGTRFVDAWRRETAGATALWVHRVAGACVDLPGGLSADASVYLHDALAALPVATDDRLLPFLPLCTGPTTTDCLRAPTGTTSADAYDHSAVVDVRVLADHPRTQRLCFSVDRADAPSVVGQCTNASSGFPCPLAFATGWAACYRQDPRASRAKWDPVERARGEFRVGGCRRVACLPGAVPDPAAPPGTACIPCPPFTRAVDGQCVRSRPCADDSLRFGALECEE